MWTRAELKARGKERFKANYWLSVVVALILSICAGGSGGSAGRSASNSINESDLQGMTGGLSQDQLMLIVGVVLSAVVIVLLIGIAISVFVTNPLSVGCYHFFSVNRDENAKFGEVGVGFKNNYMNNVKIMFLMKLFVGLWSLLLVVPGIIKAYEYMMIPYIIADDPQITSQEAFAKSKAMMTGQKWNAFVLDLSFFGWWILTVLTCGILGIFYVAPYQYATKAELYHTLKEN